MKTQQTTPSGQWAASRRPIRLHSLLGAVLAPALLVLAAQAQASDLYGSPSGQGANADDVAGNMAKVSDTSPTYDNVYGGKAGDGLFGPVGADGTSGQPDGEAGYDGVDGGNATSNVVQASGGTIQSDVYGGYGGSARQNTVEIQDDTEVYGSVYGGYAGSGGGAGNGGSAGPGGPNQPAGSGGNGGDPGADGNAVGNTVTISSGSVGFNNDHEPNPVAPFASVVGGYAQGSGEASDNELTISGDTKVAGVVFGGISESGTAHDNRVTIEGGAIGSENSDPVFTGSFVTGGAGYSAENNQVTISGGKMGIVAGGVADPMDDSVVGSGVASGNSVTITGGEIDSSEAGGLGPYYRPAVTGGVSMGDDAINNTVTISGGTIGGDVVGGYSQSGGTHGNVVKVTGGTVNGNVIGGRSGGAPVPEDTVIIGGDAHVNGDVIGGMSLSGGDSFDNRVILKGNPTFGDHTFVLGGISNGGDTYGNVLEVHTKGLTFGNVENFAEYHFLLPADTQNNDVILDLTDPEGTHLGEAQVGVAMQGGGELLQKGDRVALIHNEKGGVDSAAVTQKELTGYQGVSVQYQFKLDRDDDNLYAVTQAAPKPDQPDQPDQPTPPVDDGGSAAVLLDQTKAPVEGRLASLAFTNQGADLAAGAGMHAAMQPGDTPLFFATSGGRSHYDTGSHVDVHGFNLMLGLAKHFEQSHGQTTAAVFTEAGKGSYESHNRFGTGDVKGRGETRYVGGGILLRHDWASGLYAQGIARGGRVHYDWKSHDMVGATGEVSYDSDSPYIGAQVGLGYRFAVAERVDLDLGAQYFWSREKSDHVTLAGDRYRFDHIDSSRTRLGARASYAVDAHLSTYVGAAWQHQYDGEARATVYGMDTAAPTLKGDTGIFELGMRESALDGRLTAGLSVAGYTGTRQGASGRFDLGWAF